MIHFIFENLWINIIIETNQKVKADKKHGLLYIFGNKNQHKFSKTTQNYCIIYARSPVQLEQYSKNLENKIKIGNVC